MSETQGASRKIWVVYAALSACLVAYLVSLLVRADGQTWPWLDNWATAAFECLAGLLCLGRALTMRRDRTTPLVLGLALVVWSFGDFTLTSESAGGATPSVPSLADAFYLGFYPLSYVGVMMLVRRQVKRFSIATWLDGAVAGLGAAAICGEFAFKTLMTSAGGSAGAVATNLAYPLGDLLLLMLVVGGSTVLPDRRRARWVLLACGCLVNAAGDTANLFHATLGSSDVGFILDAMAWPTSSLLISLSVWLPAPRTHTAGHERPPGLLLPAVAAVSALAILVLGSSWRGGSEAAVGLAAATLVLAGVRCALSILRLGSLTEERHRLAVTDELTSLANRRALFELLDGLLEVRDEGPAEMPRLAFLFVDLNRFKEVNDSFGHSAGDELLRQLGGRLKGILRPHDLLVRLGGDEFGVVLMDAGADYGATIAERIGARLEEPFWLGDVRASVGASIGIAVVPEHAASTEDLLVRADLAMYRAKVRGQAFAVYAEQVDGEGSRLGLVEELRMAIDQRSLELHYQPQVDLTTGEIVAVEALVRWPHARLGLVPPLEFLPLAEDAGLMDPLTAMVLDEALSQCAIWRITGRQVAVSVNVSATNLLDPGFPGLVQQLLDDHGLPPELLVIEVTETTAMADVHRCKRAIQALHDLGLVVSVDDFGAGFTSLAYLSTLAVGELKLDRSFINGLALGTDGRNRALVGSTINLAHSLGLRVVAEGVEDEESLELLADLECNLAQGYLISRPVPAGEVTLERMPRAA